MTEPAAAAGPLLVDEVTDAAGLREFVEYRPAGLPFDGAVPPLQPTVRSWFSGTHAQARFSPVRMLVARNNNGRVVGRTCMHHNPKMDARLGVDTALFGLTEFDDDAALRALLGHAEKDARAAGRSALFGPVALLPNQTGGVITSGFQHRGFVDSPWNPDYYPPAYEKLGFNRVFTGQTWICDAFDALDPDRTFRFDDGRLAAENLRVHRARPWQLRRFLPIFRELLNAAFAQLGYYTHIDAEELADQTAGLGYILDPALTLWLSRGGEPVAFVLVIPDLSEVLQRFNGAFGIREQLAALRHRRPGEAILVVKGTAPAAQGRGYLTLLSRELLRGLQSGGYRTLRSTFVEDDNAASAAQYRRMGGRPLHDTTFYRKDLG